VKVLDCCDVTEEIFIICWWNKYFVSKTLTNGSNTWCTHQAGKSMHSDTRTFCRFYTPMLILFTMVGCCYVIVICD